MGQMPPLLTFHRPGNQGTEKLENQSTLPPTNQLKQKENLYRVGHTIGQSSLISEVERHIRTFQRTERSAQARNSGSNEGPDLSWVYPMFLQHLFTGQSCRQNASGLWDAGGKASAPKTSNSQIKPLLESCFWKLDDMAHRDKLLLRLREFLALCICDETTTVWNNSMGCDIYDIYKEPGSLPWKMLHECKQHWYRNAYCASGSSDFHSLNVICTVYLVLKQILLYVVGRKTWGLRVLNHRIRIAGPYTSRVFFPSCWILNCH